MESKTASNSETSNTRASMDDSSVDSLSLYFGSLRVMLDNVHNNGDASLSNNSLVLPSNGSLTRTQQHSLRLDRVDNNGGASLSNNSLALPSNGSLTRTQQHRLRLDGVDNNGGASLNNNYLVLPSNGSLTRTQQYKVIAEPKYESGVQNSKLVPSIPTPLYSQSIWAAPNGGETMRVSSGFAAPSTSNNASNGSLLGRDYMLSNNLNMNGGFGNQDSSVGFQYEAIANGLSDQSNNLNLNGGGFGNQDSSVGFQYEAVGNGLSDQQSLRIAEFLHELFLEQLKGYGNISVFLHEKILEHLKASDIINLSLNQSASKYLQDLVVYVNDPEIRRMIFEGVIDSILELMTNQNAIHLFGKLIESCDHNQLQLIVAKITLESELFNVALNHKCGSHSIKKLIKVLKKSPLIFEVIGALSKEFKGVMNNPNRAGSSVVMKCLDLLDNKQNDLLYQAAIKHFHKLASDEHGCLSLNYFITNSKGPGREQLLDLISKQSVFLSQDPSGNFVLQHVIGLQNPVFTKEICLQLKDHYINLSLQKGGSYVVEKCLETPWIDYVLEDFLKSNCNDLLHVARDKYGNYVIQKALKITKETDSPFHQILLMKLQPLLDFPSPQLGNGKNVFNLVNNGILVSKA